MSTLEPIQRLSVPADPAVRQRRPQSRCWHSSGSDADHGWQLSLQPTRQVATVTAALLQGKDNLQSFFMNFTLKEPEGALLLKQMRLPKGFWLKKQPIPVYVWSQLWTELFNLEWCSTWLSMYAVLPFTRNITILTKNTLKLKIHHSERFKFTSVCWLEFHFKFDNMPCSKAGIPFRDFPAWNASIMNSLKILPKPCTTLFIL